MNAAKHSQHKRCIIVGAGVAGIAAAVECALNGVQPILIESKPYIGGRARSFIEKTTGETIDNGQHLMMGCYHSFLRMLDALGTRHLLREQAALRVRFYDSNGSSDELDASRFAGKIGVAYAIWNLQKVSLHSKLRALQLAGKIQFNRARCEHRGKAMTALEFLLYHKQPQDIITRLWEPLILATLNSTPQAAAASLLVEVLRRAMFGEGNSSSLLLPRSGLSELFAPLPEFIAHHQGKLFLSTEVKECLFFDGKAIGVVTDDEQEIRGDAVLLAVPPRALERLIPPEWRKNAYFAPLADYSFSPIISLYLWFDRPIMEDDFAAMLGTTTQWVFNKRRLIPDVEEERMKQFPGHLSLTVSAAHPLVEKSGEALALHCTEELRKVFPAAAEAQLLHHKVIKEKAATFLATPHIEKKRLNVTSPVHGVFIAGDWTNTGLPATLEGAAQSGRDAVRQMLGI